MSRTTIHNLNYLPCNDKGVIHVPKKIQCLFGLPKYIVRIVEADNNGQTYLLKYFASKKSQSFPNSFEGLRTIEDHSYVLLQMPEDFPNIARSMDTLIGALPPARTKTEETVYLDGMYNHNTALVLVTGYFIGCPAFTYGVAICSTSDYLNMLADLAKSPSWIVPEFSDLRAQFQALQEKQSAKITKVTTIPLEAEVTLA